MAPLTAHPNSNHAIGCRAPVGPHRGFRGVPHPDHRPPMGEGQIPSRSTFGVPAETVSHFRTTYTHPRLNFGSRRIQSSSPPSEADSQTTPVRWSGPSRANPHAVVATACPVADPGGPLTCYRHPPRCIPHSVHTSFWDLDVHYFREF